MAFIDPLNLYVILVNMVAGSPELFLFLALIGLTIFASLLKMDLSGLCILLALFCIFMANWIPWAWALVIIIIGIYVGSIFARKLS